MAKRKSLTEIAILTLLNSRPMYGVEMVEEIKRLSGDVVQMPLPTLYSALHKMADKKFVNTYWQEAEIGGRRHIYNITGIGREHLSKNKIEINYESLKREARRQETTSPEHEHKVYATLEDAFSLPLVKDKIPVEAPAEKAPAKTPTTPYILPTDQIMSTPKSKQMSIDISGTTGGTNLRSFIKLNTINAENGFVMINHLRLFAGLITVLIFAALYTILYFTVPAGTNNEWSYYMTAFVALGVYLAVDFVFWLIFPGSKSRPTYNKIVLVRGIISFALLALIMTIYLTNLGVVPLIFGLVPGLFALVPVTEGLFIMLLHKGRLFVC